MADGQVAKTDRLTRIGVPILLAVFVLVFYRAFFFSSGVPVVGGAGDNLRDVYPGIHQVCESGPFCWSSHLFSGQRFFCSSLSPLIVLAACFLSPEKVFSAVYLLTGFVAVGGCYMLLRVLGCGIAISLAGAFVYGGSVLELPIISINVLAYMPVIFWASWRLVTEKRLSWPAVGIGAFACAMMLDAGHPQLIVYGMAIFTAILLLKSIYGPLAGWKCVVGRLGALALGLTLAFIMASHQFLPLISTGGESHRAIYNNSYFSLRSNIVDSVINAPEGMGCSTAFRAFISDRGVASLAIAELLGLSFMVCLLRRRSAQLFVLGLTGVCFLYALGDMLPFAWLLNKLLPPLGSFRDPSKVLVLTPYIVMAGGCICLERLRLGQEAVRFASALRRAALLLALWLLLLGAMAAGDSLLQPLAGKLARALRGGDLPDYFLQNFSLIFASAYDLLSYYLPYLLGCLAAALLIIRLRPFKLLAMSLPALAALGILWQPAVEMIPQDRIYPRNELISLMQAEPQPCRALNMAISRTRFIDMAPAVIYKIDMADGVDPMIYNKYYEYWFKAFPKPKVVYPGISMQALVHAPDEILDMDVLRKWNVRYIFSGKPASRPDLKQVAVYRDLLAYGFTEMNKIYPQVYVYEVQNWRPRCWIADEDAGKGLVSGIERDNLHVRCEVDAKSDLTLVNASSIPHYWRASIDGNDAAVKVCEDGSMPAVTVPAGRHKVEFRVEQEVLAPWRLIISACGALVALALLVAPLFAGRTE